jgi:nucleoid-associated protein YejK|tara:strand:- start:45435 stop:45644 length:210 start_codon:yes stop_codon:yes gene_type:complete
MISKKYIKKMEYNCIEDIFNYINESEVNGNFIQVKEMINKLSFNQFKQFMNYMEELGYNKKWMKFRGYE